MNRLMKLVAAASVAVLSATAVMAQDASVTLRLSTPNPAAHPYSVGAYKFADLVREATGGTVTVEVFPDNQLGGPGAVAQGVQLGTIDMGIVATAHLAPYNGDAAAFDLPFLFSSKQEAYNKLDGAAGSLLSQGLEAKNIVALSYFDGGFRSLFNTQRPIHKPEDLNGMKLRAINSPVTIDSIAAMGGTPVPLAWSDLYSALQQGVVSGGETGPTQMWSQKFFEVAKYMSLTNSVFTAGPIIISKRRLESLSEAQQAAVRAAALEAAKFQRNLAEEEEKKVLARLAEAGVMFNDVDMESFRKAVEPVWQKYGERFSAGFMDELTN